MQVTEGPDPGRSEEAQDLIGDAFQTPSTMPPPQLSADQQVKAPTGIGWRHPHYGELMERRPQLDFVEVHPENFFGGGGAALAVLEQGRSHYPVSLHGVGLSLGSAHGLDPWHVTQLSRLVARIDPVRVSDHACFARGTFQGRMVHANDLLPIPFSRECLQVLSDNVDHIQQELRRPFVVENLSAYLTWHVAADESAGTEAEFLNSLAQRTGCQLLVDVNNIYVNALNAARGGVAAPDPEVACRAWIDAIDPRHVAELHLAGHSQVSSNMPGDDIVIDDHGSRVCDVVWRLYGHAIRRFGAVPTLLEWDTGIPSLDTLLDEVHQAQRWSEMALAEASA